MNIEKTAKEAVERFLSGCNCAESVLMSITEHLGIRNPLIPKIATPFGGGIARSGSICGCVTAALMSIGAEYGRAHCTEDREKAYDVATDFLNAFERRFGSLTCYELIGCDFRTPEGQNRWEQLKEDRCANYVKGTVEILLRLQEETGRQQRPKKRENPPSKSS
jgi:C_GCAxxG_C_C family probable redox protein